jgi:hypothetical protein
VRGLSPAPAIDECLHIARSDRPERPRTEHGLQVQADDAFVAGERPRPLRRVVHEPLARKIVEGRFGSARIEPGAAAAVRALTSFEDLGFPTSAEAALVRTAVDGAEPHVVHGTAIGDASIDAHGVGLPVVAGGRLARVKFLLGPGRSFLPAAR